MLDLHDFQVEMAAGFDRQCCPGLTFDIVKASGTLNGIKPCSAPAELKIWDGGEAINISRLWRFVLFLSKHRLNRLSFYGALLCFFVSGSGWILLKIYTFLIICSITWPMVFALGTSFCMANPAIAKNTATRTAGNQVRRNAPEIQYACPEDFIFL